MSTALRSMIFPLLVLSACGPAKQPPTRELVELRGAPYDRGLAHGTQLRSKVRSFYATLLTNSLYPYLAREQPDIASLLSEYQADRYKEGRFAYELLLDSAKSVERTLPRAVREELQGIADGSGLTYDQVLVLNTFVDSVLAVRGVALAIRLGRSPLVESVSFLGAASDGADNDGDGDVDEAGEGVFDPWVPELNAQLVEAPVDVKLRVVLRDADGIDRSTVRITLGDQLYTADSAALQFVDLSPERLEVTLTPPAPLTTASVVSVVIGAGDGKIVDTPPPSHASFMRDEELVFTVKGAGLDRRDVRRPALLDSRTRPPTISLGVRRSATGAGTLIGQHFALLDANTAHKHTVVLVHRPDNGPAFVTVGWAGVVYGFAGMSSRGVGYACNPADTLDNSVVGSIIEGVADLSKAKLLAKGTPMGFVGRRVLEQATDAASARDVIGAASHVYGWSCIVGDSAGGLESVEVDSDIFKDGSKGIFPFTPDDVDASGRRYASVRGDDLIAGSSYSRNFNDVVTLNIAGQRVVPQRQWSGFFFRSRRAMDGLRRRVEATYGSIGAEALQTFLSDPELVDKSDSMIATVLDLGAKQVRSAMGQEPATAGPFEVTEVSP